jgi:oligoendopeptidase F
MYRKSGYEQYYGSLKNYKGTLAQNLSNYIDGNIFNAKVRSYNSALHASFDQFNLPVKIYDNLIETVRNNLQPLHRWMKLKKQILGYDTLYIYDTMVSLFSETEKEYSWEEARDLMFVSLGQLGDNYVDDIREAYDKRWVDAFPNIGKETGGYSSGPSGPHPYVKMNWGGKGLDFTTLVHEFGHFVHGYKTMRKQAYVYYDYPSFLSEIASTTAENISWAYLIDNAKAESEKLYLIGQFVDLVVLYFYTSAMNAEFERILYQTVEDGGSLSAESMSELYNDLTKIYYGEAITLTEFDSYVWAEWPHFYFGYYIYSYATSFAAAIQISEKVRSEGEPAVNRFIQFLEAGSSDYPVNVIKKAGVDLTSTDPIIAVVTRMNELMDQIEEIMIKSNLE